MNEISGVELVLSMLITWTIGLTPPLLIRYVFLRRPMGKWPAVSVCALFWVVNIVLFVALGSQSKSHTVLFVIAMVSYWLLTRAGASAPINEQRESKPSKKGPW